MNADRLKQALWWSGLAAGLLLLWALLSGLGSLLAIGRNAAVIENALHVIAPRRADPGALTWLPDEPTPRQLEPFVRDQITSDYRLAFEELTYALLTGDGSGIDSYFQGATRDDVLRSLAQGDRRKLIDWDHQLLLHFYAPDGATVAFTDRYRYAHGLVEEGDLLGGRIGERQLEVVMSLDDGNWRLRDWRVMGDREIMPGEGVSVNLAGVRGINYIARSAPFDAFWPNFAADEVAADFRRIRGLGLTTVRFFIPYPAPEGLEHLPELLELASENGLTVIPTLLDGYTRYRLEDLPAVQAYLLRLAPLLAHPGVLLVDVKNEADRDVESAGQERLRTFLRYVLGEVRRLTGKPVLVGLITPDPVLAEASDAVSLHHYLPAEELPLRLAAAGAFRKPVLLEEFGFHSWSEKLPDPHSELEQARYYQQVLDAASRAGVGWLAWTLYDLPEGAVPGGRTVERHLGILRADGSAKPVVEVLTGRPVPPPTASERLGKYLALTMALGQRIIKLLLLPLLLWIGWWAWRRRQRWWLMWRRG